MTKDISISIVTYNSEDEIRVVLNSIFSCNSVERLNVYVVDNNSSDNTTKIIEKEFPSVNLIKSNENLGFGAGHNKVINQIDSKYHIIVNPDIEIDVEVIENLAKYMDKHNEVVITTPKIISFDGTEQFLPKRYPKLKYFFGGRFETKGKIFKKWRDEYTLKSAKVSKPIDIDFCTGCFMFTKTEELKKCRGFDERYFLHFEDADLTREMQKFGRTVYNPYISVKHKWQRDNVKNRKIFFIALQSMFKYFIKWSFQKKTSNNTVKLVGVMSEQSEKS